MRTRYTMCPYLKGSSEGALCESISRLIKEMEDVSIKLCMNRHYEVCLVYRGSLQVNMPEDDLLNPSGVTG
ncbi:MAG: hypothetical protein M0Z79_00025 [Nitrospiraceae bacterium]|nr:hypothetical protein [Nitrospiraceae bacterium]